MLHRQLQGKGGAGGRQVNHPYGAGRPKEEEVGFEEQRMQWPRRRTKNQEGQGGVQQRTSLVWER